MAKHSATPGPPEERRGPAASSEVRWVLVDQLNDLNIHESIRLRIAHGLDGTRTQPCID
jgi:hypothetical protein